MDPKRFSLYGNTITPDQDRKALNWQQMFVDKFDYDLADGGRVLFEGGGGGIDSAMNVKVHPALFRLVLGDTEEG